MPEALPPTAPIVIPRSPRVRDAFTALVVRNFRRYALALGIGNTAEWAQRIAIDWLVLELTDNIALVGLTVAMQFAPFVLFGAHAGLIADRFPRRSVIIVCQATIAVFSTTLAVLVLTGSANLLLVYALVLGIGTAQAFDIPARGAFIGELAGPAHLRSAVSLAASLYHLGALVGPALAAGLIVLVGSGWSIAVNAIAAAIGIGILLTLRSSDLHRIPSAPRRSGQIREALRYIRRKSTLKWTMLAMVSVAVFGSALPTLFAGIARDENLGATGLGVASSLTAVGSLIGALAAARSRSLRLRGVVFGALGYAVVLVATGFAPGVWLLLPLLVAVGFARLSCVILGESLVQLSTNPALRGRIMAFWTLILLGGQAVGGPVVGVLAEVLGAQIAMALCGVVILVAVSALALRLARIRGLTVRLMRRRNHRLRRPTIVERSGRVASATGSIAVRAPVGPAPGAPVPTGPINTSPDRTGPVSLSGRRPKRRSSARRRQTAGR